MNSIQELKMNGHAVLTKVLSLECCGSWINELDEILSSESGDSIEGKARRIVGGRNLQAKWSSWREALREQSVIKLLTDELGASFGLVRILYFDKPPGQSWNLALHRDRTIAVDKHVAKGDDPYRKPTVKAGVAHVEADEETLNQMLTLRFHLDAMHEANGPLIVVDGSHDLEESSVIAKEVHCDAGDVFAMKPLLSHGSRSSHPDCKDHRRVVHLEFAAKTALKEPYRWNGYDQVD